MSANLEIFLAFIIIFSASLVQGATAFGFALVCVPLLLLFMPAVEVVTTSLVLACAVNLLMIRDERRAIVWREVVLLLPAASVGAVAGMLFLRSFSGHLFNSFIAAAFFLMAVSMLMIRPARRESGALLRNAVGVVSGALMGSTSMGGPPAVLYLAGKGLSKAELRGTLASFFLLANIAALAAFFSGGLLDEGLRLQSLVLFAALVPGYAAGRRLTSNLDRHAFRRLVLVSMALLSLAELGLNAASIL
jgi:hypothetical protein